MRRDQLIKSDSRHSLAAPALGAVAMFASTASAALLYNPVVTEVGNGTTPLTSAAAPTTIQVYANGAAGQAAPVAQLSYGNGLLVNTGNAISEGELANNPGLTDAATSGAAYGGTAFVFSGGYGAKDGTPAVNTTSANRVVGDMTVTGNSVSGASVPLSQPGGSTYATTGNIRAAEGNDTATRFWSAGTGSVVATGGYRYFNTNTLLSATGPSNTRTVQIRQGQLYGSSSTGGFVGISLIGNGTPPTGGQTVTPLFVTGSSTTASPEAFSLIDDANVSTPTIAGVNVPFNVAYIADAGAISANKTPGIQKWVYSPTTVGNNGWSLAYTISDVPGDGYNGLAAETVQVPLLSAVGISATDVVLFATNATNVAGGGNSLEKFIDPLEGGTAAFTDGTLINLASAPADDAFRGVALAPISVPEPGSLAFAGIALAGVMRRRRRHV